MAANEVIRIAIQNDYQNVPKEMADWSPLAGRAELTVSMTTSRIRWVSGRHDGAPVYAGTDFISLDQPTNQRFGSIPFGE